ncbi:MAG: putative oxidoreductase [Frankiales bacterium]|nr:putative oxidoreductase [Frankiales bacterium]
MLLARTGSEVRALAEDLHARYGVRAFPAAVDVTDAAAIDRVVLHAEQHLGTVDLLVNNAGRIETSERPFWEADATEMWGVVETNLHGPVLLTRALLPAMVQRGHGRVINLSSRARAASATGTYTGYAVSKRALSALTETLAASLTGTGVVVLDVLPGLVRTRMTDGMAVWASRPDDEWDDVDDVALTIVRAAQGRYDDRSGQLLDAPALVAADPT